MFLVPGNSQYRGLSYRGSTVISIHLSARFVLTVVVRLRVVVLYHPPYTLEGFGSPVVMVSDHGRHVMSSSPVPLKTRRVGQRCTLNLSRAETSSRWCGVVDRKEGASSGVVHVT
ncbi:uncharacterized protein TNCV_197891 [Trichonephila clavipes]|nr:uncharacterized protein TNCV_197891 [Trichonephila clavipes]